MLQRDIRNTISKTSTEWSNEDPTLRDDQWGYESDTGKIFKGDGSTPYSQLTSSDKFTVSDISDAMQDLVDDTSPQLGGNLDLNGNNFSQGSALDWDTNRLKIKKSTGVRNSLGNTGSSQDIDLSTGDAFTATVNGDVTFTISNAPSSGESFGFVLILTKDANSTNRTMTWPSSVNWEGGTKPSALESSGQRTIIAMVTVDGGTTYDAVQVITDSK